MLRSLKRLFEKSFFDYFFLLIIDIFYVPKITGYFWS